MSTRITISASEVFQDPRRALYDRITKFVGTPPRPTVKDSVPAPKGFGKRVRD